MPGAISIMLFTFTQETNIYGAIVKSNRQFQRFGNLPKFIYSDSFSFSFLFSGHQQVAPQLGSCPACECLILQHDSGTVTKSHS